MYISSRANPTVKLLASLSQKKHRDERGLFLLEGDKLVGEALERCEIVYLAVREDRSDLTERAEAYASSHPACQLLILSLECFDKISTEKAPQGIAAAVRYLDSCRAYTVIDEDRFPIGTFGPTLFLDGLQDPGNVGAILRSAAAFGITDVVLSADSADLYHPRTLRASMGALFLVRTHVVEDLAEAVRLFRLTGRSVYAAMLSPGAAPLGRLPLSLRDGLIVGNEGHGISPAVACEATGEVYIPMVGNTESLNASVAASVLIWELTRTLREGEAK